MKKLFLSHRLSRMKCFMLWLDVTLLIIHKIEFITLYS